MVIRRWGAPTLPTKDQVFQIFENEELEPFLEVLEKNHRVEAHKHPLDEVRMLIQGELLVDISGNKVLLRVGDRIDIPSNTTHSKQVQGDKDCISVCAHKLY